MEHLEQIYMEELAAVKPCGEAEREALLCDAASGSRAAYERLIEGHLYLVPEIAAAYSKAYAEVSGREPIGLSELVEEGNVALTLAVYEYETLPDCETAKTAEQLSAGAASERFLGFIRERIRAALEALAAQQEEAAAAAKRITAKVNLISDASTLMAKELGREATVAELADRLGMDEEEIVSGMKLAFDAMDSMNTMGEALRSDEAETDGNGM